MPSLASSYAATGRAAPIQMSNFPEYDQGYLHRGGLCGCNTSDNKGIQEWTVSNSNERPNWCCGVGT
jgi:hypothetical protein